MKKAQDISILSLSLITGVATLLSASIPSLVEYYSNYHLGSIESLVTVPSLGSIFTIIFNSFFVKKMGMKKTVLLGIFLVTISGVLPFFMSNFVVVFLLRFVLGLGIGLFSPHAISLISIFYEGQKKATLLGMQVGISALGNSIFLLLAAIVIHYHWQSIYLLHLILIPIFFLIFKFVPEVPTQVTHEKTGNRFAISKQAVIYLSLCLWTFIIIFGVQLKVPTLLSGLENGNTSLGGLTLSLMNLMGLFAGVLFGFLLKRFHYRLFAFGYIGAGIMVLVLALSSNVILSMISAILFNFIYSFTGPYIILQLNTFTPNHEIAKINSLFSLMIIGSQFIAPIFWNTFSTIINASTIQLLLYIAIMLIGTGLLVGYNLKEKR
ncbi:MFS transporter [Paenibacillus durus]|uniref:Major facilitator superfamily (MFS) profile domain-containing protein n=1 Tax=Paenibacillus durus ATCC 35681 TaxID=1333534 RepID=A0A0F7FB21_PAEDU|nr:MFS transporter [Paenibacillus durus]AKG35804.1 hypothetical protein VK70_15485 [Paenibacillus durus ATCC 35681]